jgi:hypothetical protein
MNMCKIVEETNYLQAGWGCCRCKTYNGLHRDKCKFCGVAHCDVSTAKETLEARKED